MTTGRINQVASTNNYARSASVVTASGKATQAPQQASFMANDNSEGLDGAQSRAHVSHMDRIQENSRYQ